MAQSETDRLTIYPDSQAVDTDNIVMLRGNENIVDTTIQHYGYDRMMSDLRRLHHRYPKIISVELRDTTEQGRPLPLVHFGSPQAKHRILIQAAMHAREYLTSQLVMALLEHYASGYDTQSWNGKTYRQTFDSVSVTLLPMVNPDGVEIAQRGAEGTTTLEAHEWVDSVVAMGVSHRQIKSNANGVDINRNFPRGFGRKTEAKGQKSFFYYEGPQPYSEVESRFMMEAALKCKPAAFLNYHTSGNMMYWGAQDALAEVNYRALEMAYHIHQLTGYPMAGPEEQTPCGTWADEVMPLFRRPSVTIEVGTRNPVPIAEFHDIFRLGLHVWAELCQWINQ